MYKIHINVSTTSITKGHIVSYAIFFIYIISRFSCHNLINGPMRQLWSDNHYPDNPVALGILELTTYVMTPICPSYESSSSRPPLILKLKE